MSYKASAAMRVLIEVVTKELPHARWNDSQQDLKRIAVNSNLVFEIYKQRRSCYISHSAYIAERFGHCSAMMTILEERYVTSIAEKYLLNPETKIL